MDLPTSEGASATRRVRLWRALWLACLGLLLIAALALLLGKWMAGRSVDVAGHYVAVNYFSHYWDTPPQVIAPRADISPSPIWWAARSAAS